MGSEPGRGRWHFSEGILVVRWAFLILMGVLAAVSREFRYPAVAIGTLVAATVWTAWMTRMVGRESWRVLWADLAFSFGLLLVSGFVMKEGEVVGRTPFFATAYPAATVLLWGAVGGPWRGLLCAAAMSIGLLGARAINGVSLGEMTGSHIGSVANGVMSFLVAGVASGLVARLLDRSDAELRQATEERLRVRERAARLAERETLARAIHDSVLQSLALVHKRGRELSEQKPTVPAEEVRRLADMAAQQERVLRSLILQEIDAAPTGTASLRRTLEAEAARTEGIPVTVNAVGPVWLAADHVDEVAAAVRQALDNVVQHAEASRAAVFLDDEDDWVTIAVRDNGRGFDYDEGRFRDAGKVGMIRSMRGRIEGLGGRMRVDTAPGLGTEVEFRIPATAKGSDDEGDHPGGRGGRPSALAQSRSR